MQLDSVIILAPDPALDAPRHPSHLSHPSHPSHPPLAPARALPAFPTESEPRTASPVTSKPEVTHDTPACVIGPVPSDPVDPSPPSPSCSPSASSASSAVLPSSSPSADAERIRSQRLSLVRTVDAYVTQHQCSVHVACTHLHISQSTYARHATALASGGADALLPGYARCGRKSTLDILCPTEDRDWLVTRLRLLNGRTHGAQTAADLIAREPECPPAIAAYLLRAQRIPRSILRAARLTPSLRARFNGPRAYQHASIVNLRDMTEALEDGTILDIRPGDWWELDDMSVNTEFWYEVPADSDGRAVTVDGIGLGRQGLYCQDLASGKWLGHVLIGRPRDAYRAADILRFLKQLMLLLGKPRRGIRIEQGSWKSNCITGTKLPTGIALSSGEEQDILLAGIRDLGIRVQYCYTSRGKCFIEGSFKHLQDIMAASDFPNIGRMRGEGEAASAALIRSRAGTCHPSAAGFGHITEISQLVTWAEQHCNSETKRGRLIQGIPDERWLASITLDPLPLLTPKDHAVFLPQRSTLQIRGGHVTPTRDGKIFPYHSAAFPALGDGYRLLVAFDPAEPELGCALWHAETSSARPAKINVGDFLGFAAFEPLSPQFGPNPDPRSRENRKADHDWHRTEYAILQPGKPVSTQSTLRDGQGRTVHVTRDAPQVRMQNAECRMGNTRMPAPARDISHESHQSPRSHPSSSSPASPSSPAETIDITTHILRETADIEHIDL